MDYIGEYTVAPEVLENKAFDFTEDQKNQIRIAKRYGKKVHGYFIAHNGGSKIASLNIVWGGE